MKQIDPNNMASIQFTQTMIKENGFSKKQCAKACVTETRFSCKYFRYISGMGTCYLAVEEHLKIDHKAPQVDQDMSQFDLFQERLSAMELLVKFLGKKINKLEEMQEKLANLKIQVMKESKKKYTLMNEVRKSAMNQEASMDLLTDKVRHMESKDESNLAIVETFREMVSDIEKQNAQIKTTLKGLSLKIRDLMSEWTMISSEIKSINADIVGIGRKLLEGGYRSKELDNKIEIVKNEGIKREQKMLRKVADIEKMEKELLNSDSLEGRQKMLENQLDVLSSNTALNTASLEELEASKNFHSNAIKGSEILKEISKVQNSVFDLENKQQNLEDMLMMDHLYKNVNGDKQMDPLQNTGNNVMFSFQKNQLFKPLYQEHSDKSENTDEDQNHLVMSVSHAGIQRLGEDDHMSHVETKLNVVQVSPQDKEFSEESMQEDKDISKCPSGWYKSVSRCLSFLPDLVDWDEAKSRCGNKGGRVAAAENMDQWKSIRIFLAIHTNLSSSVWLSRNDDQSEIAGDNDGGQLKKTSGSFHPRSVSLKFHLTHTIKEADCLVMEPINKFSLTKAVCNSAMKHATVCERELLKRYNSYETLLSRLKHSPNNQLTDEQSSGSLSTELSSPVSPLKVPVNTSNVTMVERSLRHAMHRRNPSRRSKTCPYFGQQVNGLCFKYISSQQTVAKALNTCKGMGGRLVTVENVETQIALEKFLINLGIFHTVWLSPSVSSDGIRWTWESNRSPVTYTNYLDGRPDPENRHRCNQMRKEWAFKWLDKYCSDSTNNNVRYSFVCQF